MAFRVSPKSPPMAPNCVQTQPSDNCDFVIKRKNEKISFIPKDCMGLVIGRKGATLQRISKESGAHLEVINREIYIDGTSEDQDKAFIQIRQIIDSRNQNPSKAGMEKLTFIPEDLMGLVIGARGSTLRQIALDTGATLNCIHGEIYVSGSPESQEKARLRIKQIIVESRNQNLSKEGMERLTFIPEDLMGLVIGARGSTLRQIALDTGATLNRIHGEIYVGGSPETQEKARFRIKQIIMDARAGQSSGRSVRRLCFIDSSCVGKDALFQLEPVPLPNPLWYGHYYRVKLDDDSEYQRQCNNVSELQGLQTELLSILKDLHEAHDMEVDIRCHFGRVYLTSVDEENENGLFTATEIENKFKLQNGNQPSAESRPSWRTHFKEGITELEVQGLERNLVENLQLNMKEDRWDFDFITPTIQKIHSKVWLVKTDKGEVNYALCPPRIVRNQLGRVMSEELEATNSSRDPSFYLCATYRTVMTADVILPGHRFDCRIIIRQCQKEANSNQDAQVKQEVEEISDYLRNMRTDDNGIVLPQEIPEGYELAYRRQSIRQTYSYDSNGVPCFLIVCKEEFKEGAAEEKSDPESHVDIHLRCDEWDNAFQEGQWEPEQVAEKLPQFLYFVKKVQQQLQLLDEHEMSGD